MARDIIRDLAGVDSWWRSQDPARTPRFDLATFPDCDTEFGALDLSSVQLSADNATLDPTAPDFTSRMGSELTRAGFTNTDKKYLVFYDGAGPADFCGVSNGSPSRGGPSVASYVFSRGMACCLGGDDERTLLLCTAETSQDDYFAGRSIGHLDVVRVEVPGVRRP